MKFISVLVVGFLFVLGFTDIRPLGSTPETTIAQTAQEALAQIEEETWVVDTTGILTPQQQHFRSTLLISSLLNQHHYRKVPVDDSLSSVIFDKSSD